MRNAEKHVKAEGGSYRLAIENIVCHLNLMTDEQKAAINWHPEQSASLAVMRLISIDDYRNVEKLRSESPQPEDERTA